MCIKVTALNSTPFVPSEKAQYSKPQFCTVISQKFVLVKFVFLHGYSGRLKVAYQLRESDILNTSTGFTLSRWSWMIYSGHSEQLLPPSDQTPRNLHSKGNRKQNVAEPATASRHLRRRQSWSVGGYHKNLEGKGRKNPYHYSTVIPTGLFWQMFSTRDLIAF